MKIKRIRGGGLGYFEHTTRFRLPFLNKQYVIKIFPSTSLILIIFKMRSDTIGVHFNSTS